MPSSLLESTALTAVLTELEVERKKIASNKTISWSIILLGFVAAVIFFCVDQQLLGLIIALAGIFFGGIILYRTTKNTAHYKYRYKQEVVKAALGTINESLTINPNQGITTEEFSQSQLFTVDPDRYATEDLIEGKRGKTVFRFAEVHAEYKTEVSTKNGQRTEWHNIFKGIIFCADFNKNFNGITVIRPKDIGSSIGAWFSKHIYAFGNKNIVELENESFNKNFVTYSTDQIEARYVLTPALMEKVCALNDRSAYCVLLSFIRSNIYIAFPLDQNYFEPPIFKTLLRPDLLEADLTVLHFMNAIVEELDLNTRIWTKL